jgi:hypothetical protein
LTQIPTKKIHFSHGEVAVEQWDAIWWKSRVDYSIPLIYYLIKKPWGYFYLFYFILFVSMVLIFVIPLSWSAGKR